MAHDTRSTHRPSQRDSDRDSVTQPTIDTVVTESHSLQAAITDAAPGDVLGIATGTFTEQVVVDTPVALVGLGAETTTVRAPSSLSGRFDWAGDAVAPVISVEADGVALCDLAVERGYHPSVDTVVGVGSRNAGVHLDGVSVRAGGGETTRFDVGILALTTDGSRRRSSVTNCRVRGYRGSGVIGSGSGSDFRVTATTVAGRGPSAAGRQHGVRTRGVDRVTLLGNTVADNYDTENSVSAGISITNTPDAFVAWNDIEGNNNGIVAQDAGDIVARRNNIRVNDTGVLNLGTTVFDATNNWWGAPDGPSPSAIWDGGDADQRTETPATGTGDAVYNVEWEPFESKPVDTAVWNRVHGQS